MLVVIRNHEIFDLVKNEFEISTLDGVWLSYLVTPQQYISFLALCATPDREKLLNYVSHHRQASTLLVYIAVPRSPIA